MVTLETLRRERRAEILKLAEQRGARNLRVFGSVARGEATHTSDLDLLVEWEPGRSLLDHVALKQDLEDLLGVSVDIGSERGLHWFVRDNVLQEAVPL
ncbi:MAG: nucleotidyltransferase family protein [Acidobacteria bacterium]|nr:nucleotidyltransferase family protein [Acidobacteriota bacterium]